ncbi:glutathione S-transferase family protein [Microvirga zambiensis]|uniref:glutathione S-transferase family protein n=1 Tax=Microvirga zambiensis TaxID=1402137 RepID=UPI00191F8CD8|nr:glutathione S-transferase family protein [Microvirga zambiensis]
MRLYVSPTSPYARLACVMCLEARLKGLEIVILDPWQNPPELLEHNPAGRVPALVMGGDQPRTITESLLIADFAVRRAGEAERLWFRNDAEQQLGGVCFGIIDAAAAIMAGRMVTSGSVNETAFDSSPVARRRQAAIGRSLDRLERLLSDGSKTLIEKPGIAAFLPVIVVEYLQMRFGSTFDSADRWHLADLVSVLRDRPALARTRPLFTKFVPFDHAGTE